MCQNATTTEKIDFKSELWKKNARHKPVFSISCKFEKVDLSPSCIPLFTYIKLIQL